MSNPGQGNPGMDPEIFEQFIDQLRRYVRERLIPAEEDVIANDAIPDDILAEMREMGLFGITIPEEFGGAGMNISQYIETVKQLAYAAPAYRSTMSINVGMTGSAIKNFGTAEQKAHWLPRIASGEIACFGLTEPGSGSDSAAMQTFAARDGNGYVLNGTKRYITNSPHAKIGLIMARTSKEALPKNAHVSCFIIDMDNGVYSYKAPASIAGSIVVVVMFPATSSSTISSLPPCTTGSSYCLNTRMVLPVAISTIIVSPTARPKPIMIAEKTPGLAVGSTTLAKVVAKLAIAQGASRIEFPDVSAQIQPETLSFAADDAGIVEQNFDFDLLTPQKLLEKYVGRSLGQIAAEENKHPIEVMLDLSLAGQLNVEFLGPDKGFNAEYMADIINGSDFTIPGVSDGGAHTKFFTGGAYTTDFLYWLVRDEGRITLEEAHYRLSALPARAACPRKCRGGKA